MDGGRISRLGTVEADRSMLREKDEEKKEQNGAWSCAFCFCPLPGTVITTNWMKS